jgi:transcriptional regulator with XRE-family HTH domain
MIGPRSGSAGRPASRQGATATKKLIGLRLRLVRQVLYDSMAECARRNRVPENTWRNWEKGERFPDPPQLVAFCDAHGITMDWIYRNRIRGMDEEVQIRLVAALAAHHPALLDADPDVGRPSREAVQAAQGARSRA